MTGIQYKLNKTALIIRKYNLGDKNYFVSKFKTIGKSNLDIAWTFAENKIQNREIIKDASRLTFEESNLVNIKINEFDNNTNKLYEKLNSKFDVKELNLKDENVERKLRNILALRFIQNISYEIIEFSKKESKSFQSKFLGYFVNIKYALVAVTVIGIFLVPRVIEGMTTPGKLLNEYLHEKYPSIKSSKINSEALTKYLHEDSKYKFSGSVCNDGWKSHSQGRGACSHHGGVAYIFFAGEYSKSLEQCRKESITIIAELREKAYKKSWRD